MNNDIGIDEIRRKQRSNLHESGEPSSNGKTRVNGHGHDSPFEGEVPSEGDEVWAEPSRRHGPQTEPLLQSRRLLAAPPRDPGDEESLNLPFDTYRILDAIKSKWLLILLAGLCFGGLGLSWLHYGQQSQLTIQLVRRETPALFQKSDEPQGGSFGPQQFTDQALVNMIQTSDALRRAWDKTDKTIPILSLARCIKIWPDRDSESVMIGFKGSVKPVDAVNFVNLYAGEVLQYTRDIQSKEAKTFHAFIDEKLDSVNNELTSLAAEMKNIPAEARVVDTDEQTKTLLNQLTDLETKYEMLKIDLEANNPIQDQLQTARDELSKLLLKYTDAHPLVQRQRTLIKELEQQLEKFKTTGIAPSPSTADAHADNVHMLSAGAQKQSLAKQAEQTKALLDHIKAKLTAVSGGRNLEDALRNNRYQSLIRIRTSLAEKQRQAELFEVDPPGYFNLVAPASIDRVLTKGHVKKALLLGIFGALFGMLSVTGLVVVREIFDDRVKSVADLERATELPVLGTLGDISKMDSAAQKAWAFRTWTILKGKLSASQNQGCVCGFISAHHGEGRSTWVKLLVNTATERGLRVLRISTKPTGEPAMHPHETISSEEQQQTEHALLKSGVASQQDNDTKTLQPSALAFPAQVARELNDPENSTPVVHIPLPGWVWNLDRRKQWQNALTHWRKIDNLVLLVELPPADEPESVLLAEKVPQVVWLTESGKTTLKETRQHLETLRHAGCNLVGTVLNREPKSFFRSQVSRWFTIAVLLFGLGINTGFALGAPDDSLETPAAEVDNIVTNVPPQGYIDDPAGATQTNRSFFSSDRHRRGAWQEHLTLGPGDMLNLGFFGETNLTKNDVAIGPDGRISYLQATDVMAAGLTVDELRETLDKELAKYYRSPRSIVTPVHFESKKYFILGKVMNKGVYILDRPTSLLEAIGRARGLETGMLNRNSIDLADLQRAFLIRQGKRVPIDFEKLFYEGDLSQNVPMEPDDFLYFPPLTLKEVYIVGEVNAPGVLSYTRDATLMKAIADRGGFSNRAFKSRVLVVRGSLNHPDTFAVNTHDIVDGKMPDFRLKPKDIVYVSSRPFIKVEELLDLAATSFIQGAATAWTGQYIGPFITKPFIGGIYKNK